LSRFLFSNSLSTSGFAAFCLFGFRLLSVFNCQSSVLSRFCPMKKTPCITYGVLSSVMMFSRQ
jgi:hypothetical protein